MPRWIQVPAAILLAVLTLISVVGAVNMLLFPHEQHRWLIVAIGAGILLLGGWCLTVLPRLATGRPTRGGGLLSPFALRAVSIAFLVLPFVGLFTGHYEEHGLLAIQQGITYLVIFVALQRIARERRV